MKKFFIFLILLIALLCFTSCSPKWSYFTTDTVCPQCVVDSLLKPRMSPEYHTWAGFQVLGINAGDSTVISTYVYSVDKQTITVVEYGNSELTQVTEKRKGRKKK